MNVNIYNTIDSSVFGDIISALVSGLVIAIVVFSLNYWAEKKRKEQTKRD